MADQIVTNPGDGGNGGLYFIVGGIVVALVVVVALMTGVFSVGEPQTARNPAKEIDITIKPPAAPAPAPSAPAPGK